MIKIEQRFYSIILIALINYFNKTDINILTKEKHTKIKSKGWIYAMGSKKEKLTWA